MKLKIRNLNWLAGRPIVILNDTTAKKMNVFVDDRVLLENSRKVYAVVDIFPNIVRENEIGLSQELSHILKMENREEIDVNSSEISQASFLINKKIHGKELTKKEISYIVSEIVQNNLTEAEIAYFTAAEKIHGMSIKETINLTKAMVKTGLKLKFNEKYVADKHCIGGIAGNRTTPIVVAICASMGLTMPKTSSRAITSASGTADVIEVLSNVELTIPEIKKVVKKTGACLTWGGSLGLAPSDDKIIRVERLLNLDAEPQLISSIMSKKISAGSKYILIDIPYGEESKIKNLKEAKILGGKFKKIAKSFRLKLKTVYTKGLEPIGNGIGPILELLDVISVLRNDFDAPSDLREKSLYLSAELMSLCGIKDARIKAENILSSGKAYDKFKEILQAQDGEESIEEKIKNLKLAKFKKTFKAKRTGKIISISNKKINSLCRILGTPETKSAGVYLHRHIGNVSKREPILTMYSETRSKLKDGKKFYKTFKPIKIK
ncbi:MAG: thymidine phosphorylase [Candidatus Pacearchaeota archaeon]